MQRNHAVKKSLLLLFFIFLISVAVRLPHINRSLSTNYEWVTAHTLVTLQIWESEGIFTHGFNPIYTFPNPNDHHIKCPISGVADQEGNYYYVSYPPFAFIAPHLIFSIFDIKPTVLTLQIFNLVLHFLCGIFIFLIINLLIPSDTSRLSSLMPAVFGAAFYFFSPLNLWHHANVYFADILVQFLFIVDVFLVFIFFSKPQSAYRWLLVGIGILLFLTMYTEWLGYLLTFVVFIYALSQLKKHPAAGILALVCCASVISALGLTILQYSSINGLESFFDLILNRYEERSGQFGINQFYQLISYQYLLNLYVRNYFPVFILIALLFLIKFIFKQSLTAFHFLPIFVITLIPALLHHLVLFEFTLVHDLALVKTSVFLCIVIGILLYVTSHTSAAQTPALLRYLPYVFSVCMMGLSVFFYNSHVITPTFSLEKLGTTIKENSSPDDTIFFKTSRTLGDFLIAAPVNFVIAPQIQYYSGRCIQVVPSLEEAENHLVQFEKEKGIVFTIENLQYEVENIERISLSDTTRSDVSSPQSLND